MMASESVIEVPFTTSEGGSTEKLLEGDESFLIFGNRFLFNSAEKNSFQ